MIDIGTTGEGAGPKNPSIGRGIWQSFMLLTLAIIAILWLMQTVFLTTYYKSIKKNQIIKASRHVTTLLQKENFVDSIIGIATDNNLTIALADINGQMIIEVDMLGRGNILRNREYERRIAEYFKMAQEGTLTEKAEIIFNPYVAGDSLLVGKAVTMPGGSPGVLFLTGTIEPIWATADILKSQLIIISALLPALSALIALFLTRRISRPIVNITKSAKKLACGDYTPDFEGGTFSEIGDLATTLNSAAQELGRVEQLRRELVANVSHDLRTPLTMIKAYAEMLRDITGGNPEKRQASLGIIVDEADRLGRLVSDLVAISREETGGESLEITDYDIVPQIVRLSERFRMSYPDFSFSVSTGSSCGVRADMDKIDQVFYNLVGNAVNYSGEDMTVRLRQSTGDGVTRIEILDSGVGIPEDEMRLIWQRYYRSSFHKTAKAGTGLGLAIVKDIMDAHGATFGAFNRPEGGSCFWFELPLATGGTQK